ncbi:hypothetical protein R3P38DRAFT_2872609 [Favolaschia claudopus]|uniref:Uncharacterized protein n=1 Tax=Favolaschia claudopus TaxID=2862362 RepID=A0AAW0DDD4_9AGAR
MENGHRALDDTLDGTGLSAFIPHAVHEVSDGAQGLVKRGLDDFGRTTGAVLRSFDQHNLHGSDKSLGGNLRQTEGTRRVVQPSRRHSRDRGHQH